MKWKNYIEFFQKHNKIYHKHITKSKLLLKLKWIYKKKKEFKTLINAEMHKKTPLCQKDYVKQDTLRL